MASNPAQWSTLDVCKWLQKSGMYTRGWLAFMQCVCACVYHRGVCACVIEVSCQWQIWRGDACLCVRACVRVCCPPQAMKLM
jgi:hypothetical protein